MKHRSRRRLEPFSLSLASRTSHLIKRLSGTALRDETRCRRLVRASIDKAAAAYTVLYQRTEKVFAVRHECGC
jgi:hypothetical protein